MKNFKDFNIKPETKAFTGDKIKISKILNREITVHNFKVGNSKHNAGKCLDLQIELNGTKHVVFTGSVVLIDQINKVPTTGFPFTTTIIEESDRYEFS